MSSNLNSFDLIAALTESAINSQLNALHQQGVIPSSFSYDFGSVFESASMDITDLGAPYVVINADDTSYHDLILVLPINAGTYTENNVPIDIVNWTFAFTVDMSLADLTADDLQARIAAGTTPQSVSDSAEVLNAALDVLFSMQHLFMDFTNANLAEFDTSLTVINYNPSQVPASQESDTTTAIITVLTAYFQSLAGTDNPYILGYPMTAPPQTAPSDVAPTFIPSSITYSTTPGDSGSGTLNFLFMTNGDAAPTGNSAVVFDTPFAPGEQGHSGIFAISADLLMAQMVPPLMAGFGTFTSSQFHWSGNAFAISDGAVTEGDMAGGTIDVSITTAEDTGQMTCAFTYRMTKDASFLGLNWITTGTITQTATWSVIWDFSVSDSGTISGTVNTGASSAEPDVSYDVDQSLWAQLVDLFVPIAGLANSLDILINLQMFPDVTGDTWDAGSATLSLIMPAGDVFTFADSRFDNQSNSFVDVTYNS